MHGRNVVAPASTALSSLNEFAAKKDRLIHSRVDYKKLNAMTIKDSYLLPSMDRFITSSDKPAIFSKHDPSLCCWKTEIRPGYREKTAFESHYGLFQLTGVPFVLPIAPGTFQKATNAILSFVKWKSAVMYIDGIVVLWKTVKNHCLHLLQIITLQKDSGVTVEWKTVSSWQRKLIISSV